MERKYREITLKRRRLFRSVLVCGMLLLVIWAIFSLRNWNVWEGMWKAGTNCIKPAVFRYEEVKFKKKDTPFWVWFAFPKIFAYTWQESVPAFQVIEVVEDETKETTRESVIAVSLNQDSELSLLQENIYTANRYMNSGDKNLYEMVNAPAWLEMDGVSVVNRFPVSKYVNMSELIKDYYIIDASTSPDSNLLNVDYMANYDCKIAKDTEEVQILIYHSHSQEGFADSVPGDVSTTIVGAGARLKNLLEEEYGFKVMHHTGVYDVPSRDNAYSNALPAVEKILDENPSIQVVIDLHRDAVNEGTKLVKTINGKDYARFMFFNGICRSTKGTITYLNNPYLKENLAFSFQAQTIAENYFPGITRKIYLKAWRYNMHFRPRNMLIELGAQTNTVEEIMNTCEILAFVINQVLSGQ